MGSFVGSVTVRYVGRSCWASLRRPAPRSLPRPCAHGPPSASCSGPLREALRGFGPRIVVDAGGVDLEHLPPEHLLRRPDVADACEQLVEVVAAAAPLEALVVQG